MDIGFVENVVEQPNGSLLISGWARAASVEIALVWEHRPEQPVLLLSVRPDIRRDDIPDVPSAGFQVLVGNEVRSLLPPSISIAASADGELLPALPGANLRFNGQSDAPADLEEQLRAGFRWHRKTGQWYLPIAAWPESRRTATIALLAEVVTASERMITPAKGTLLGILRSGTLLPHDDDVDAAAYLYADSIEELVGRWSALIASTARLIGARISFADDLFHALLIRGDAFIDCWPVWLRHDGSFIDVHGPGTIADTTPMAAVLDQREMWIPRRSSELLEHAFGREFLTPDPSWRAESLGCDEVRRAAGAQFRAAFNSAMVPRVTVV